MVDSWDTSTPDYAKKNNIKQTLGPGDRTQVLEHYSLATLPAEPECLVVQIITNNYYII